jgi:hypothetical protein
VTRFDVDARWLSQFDVQLVGGEAPAEYWIPAERLDELNRHLVGAIQAVAEFR